MRPTEVSWPLGASRSASGRDGGTEVRTPNRVWKYDNRDGLSPRRLAPKGLAANGYAIATHPFATALWHNGDILQLDLSSGKSSDPERDGIHAVNGRGWAVGQVDARAMLWQDERRIVLGEEVGGPKLDGAIAISENGNVLATSGSMLYLLRRRD